MDEDKIKKSSTTGGITEGYEDSPAPGPIKNNGQHSSYWVLSEEERNKGFIRPLRDKYVHVGISPKNPLRDLTDKEKERHFKSNYVKFEEYPESDSAVTGRYWTQKQLDTKGCGVETIMNSDDIVETYARDPKYYGSTFCVGCGEHFRVEAFVWSNTNDKVGS